MEGSPLHGHIRPFSFPFLWQEAGKELSPKGKGG